MNKQLLFALSLALLPGAAMAIDVQPGLWTFKTETKNTVKAVDKVSPTEPSRRVKSAAVDESRTRTNQLCLSEDTAKDMRVLLLNMSRSGHSSETCVDKESEKGDNRIRIVRECTTKADGRKRTSAVTLTKVDDKNFTFRSRAELDEGHQVVHTSNSGWVGANCGDLTPQ